MNGQARIGTMIALSISSLVLASCVSKLPPPAIQYDKEAFEPAAVEADPPKAVTIVKIPEPLPLPGQLQAVPSAAAPDTRPPTARVDAANAAALQEPSTHGYINAVQIYPFVEGALYRLYAAPEQVSDITLEAGETLVAVSAGDTVRWVVGNTTSGASGGERVHILVKPFAPSLKTNMVITTDRRTYHLALESTDSTAMAALSWTYPEDQLIALKAQNEKADAVAPVASRLALENLHFRYAITGDTPPWRPLRAFDDGSKVYIEFPGRIDQGETPPLFVVGPTGDNELVNYRVRRNYYIVDRLFAAAELRLGQDPQQVVRISRDDAVQSNDVPSQTSFPRPTFRRER
ncbi:P-type conjugative transfer protein TrbG [Dongia sedimenti]|uniref:P-type conjugative transfer protein TrbG n=1 Tax=Dongia sedimenti TaxID=3064282 RepID=A0ABU0YUA1_9PROT|nr:P-type conjugative transfer protein TrbG [Rhodospirillaceae bacterium R-7]